MERERAVYFVDGFNLRGVQTGRDILTFCYDKLHAVYAVIVKGKIASEPSQKCQNVPSEHTTSLACSAEFSKVRKLLSFYV